MEIRFIPSVFEASLMEPLNCRRDILDIAVAGKTIKSALEGRLRMASESADGRILSISPSLWPSEDLAEMLAESKSDMLVKGSEGQALAWVSQSGDAPSGSSEQVQIDEMSILVKHPWDVLKVHEELCASIKESCIKGTVREGVTIDGTLVLGEGSTILPGVYMEGVVVMGRNCKVGPNCYIRGSTAIGDNCHIGQAVEIKNSILMDKVSAGHLSYVGDSIICPKTNLGAGTITANFRHDGKSHRSMADGKLLDTGRRKFGTIIGDNVHTGVHTSIYPGRKLWPDVSTLPGGIVNRDIVS